MLLSQFLTAEQLHSLTPQQDEVLFNKINAEILASVTIKKELGAKIHDSVRTIFRPSFREAAEAQPHGRPAPEVQPHGRPAPEVQPHGRPAAEAQPAYAAATAHQEGQSGQEFFKRPRSGSRD